MRVRVFLATAALVLASCGVPEDEAVTETTSTIDVPTTTTTERATTSTGAPAPPETTMPSEAELIQTAIRDLSRRLLTPEEAIEVVETRSVSWPDGSIGCPKPGGYYTQAVVDGIQVLLGADGKVYDYHAGDDGQIFLCPSDDKDGGYEFVPPPRFDE